MDAPVLADQQELNKFSSVRTLDVVRKTSQERWMTGTDGQRERERERERFKCDLMMMTFVHTRISHFRIIFVKVL